MLTESLLYASRVVPWPCRAYWKNANSSRRHSQLGAPVYRHPYRAEAGWDRLGLFVPVQESEAAFAFWVGCSQSRTLLPFPYVAWLPVEMPGVIYRFLFSL